MSLPRPPVAVFADANVLYPSALRDILIELALDETIRLRWSPMVLDELVRALVRSRAEFSTSKGLRLIAAMSEALPDALVMLPDPLPVTAALPDPDDIHVLVAAQIAECSALLTFNVKDFPLDLLASANPPLEPVHPDAFLVKLLTTRAAAVLPVIERVRQSLTVPPMAVPAYADSLARSGLPQTGDLLRYLLQP